MLATDPRGAAQAALAAVGPRPLGDPAGMRALAASLRDVARSLGAQRAVRLQNWESPRGRAVRADVGHAVGTAGRAAGDLDRAAGMLEREADAVEGEIAAWEARRQAALSHIPASKI